jgi:hypothetical protein
LLTTLYITVCVLNYVYKEMKLITAMYCIMLYVISSRKKASNLIEIYLKNSIKTTIKKTTHLILYDALILFRPSGSIVG